MDIVDVTARFFQNGGPFMYPIAVVLTIGLAIALERWLVLSSARMRNRSAFNKAMQHLKQQDYNALIETGNKSKVPMYRIVAAGLSRFANSRRRGPPAAHEPGKRRQ